MDETTQDEVIVVGGGMVGAALAALLGEAGISVTVLDARPAPLASDEVGRGLPAPRVSALTPVSQRLLTHLGAWSWMAERRVSPYQGMRVWDGEGSGEIAFEAVDIGLRELGHIVENDIVLAGLETRLAALPSVTQRYGARVSGIAREDETQTLTLDDGSRWTAPLVVAADGARSPLRRLAGIEVREHDTGHVALVTTLRCEQAHGGVARQVFLPDGPLAFLPLRVDEDDHHCSIVWSTRPEHAEKLLALSPEAFAQALGDAMEGRLGKLDVLDKVHHFPLTQRHARDYTAPGLALIGDAAHSIHPLAGQGVNLGFLDAAVLAEEIIHARQRGVALGDARTLARYARRRRGDNAAMLALMDGFRLLFGARHPALRLIRNVGLSSTDKLMPLKRIMIRQAAGERGELPAVCR
ncbi:MULTISPECIES: UbiH/UbiF/VisC/COQ6 family ubiquinone biosynthesis hydroxylase [Chromohalobacter]|nr:MULTISPECIES: UbiH/UbiF/VisC/COQ6 family ubiquinone biosynthesis hydroxylase [Chromohalobacter]MCI0509944.1 UbiH/UbiF/VisC/COQ6 family ubiquinone biosynthesis hydroxylase [Chromohalobacter sp.]MCI0593124.1 UbiH/UbiF/VisC/COQ6 family ubiquinone biosynthesis hydroxylase [Chromohalobacter sp.]